MSKLKIKTKERRFETARDLYGIFFEDINRAGDGGLYPEMLRNRSFEDSVLPEGYIQQEDGIHVKTVSGWLDEFCNGEGLCRWVKGNNIPETEIPAWYTHNAKMELELTDTLNEHRDAALRMQFEKEFHRHFYEMCDRNYWYTLLESLSPHFDRTTVLSFRCRPVNGIVSDHEELVDAIAARDRERAAETARRHMLRYTENIDTIRQAFPEYFA